MSERSTKARSGTVISTRKIVAGEHLNPNGTLFGGHLMCWIDEVAFMCARRYSGHPFCVTASIDNITFRTPIHLGEHVLLTSAVNHVGQSSMYIEVTVEKEDPVTHQLVFTNSAFLTFVALDTKGRPVPVPRLSTNTEIDRFKFMESALRIKIRKRLDGYLAKRVRLGVGEDTMRVHSLPPSNSWDRLSVVFKSSVEKLLDGHEKNLSNWIDRLGKSINS
jgi:acyl-CoA hydrolase